MAWKRKGTHCRDKNVLTTFLHILGSLHGNRKRPIIIFSSKEQKYNTALLLFFFNPSRSGGRKVRREHIKMCFSLIIKCGNFCSQAYKFWLHVLWSGSFLSLFSLPQVWFLMSFCCFYSFLLSSLISHSRLQSNLFFPECIIQAAEPGCHISQRPGIRASFCSLSGRGTSHPGPCWCLSCQSAVISAPQCKPAQPLGTKREEASFESICRET